MDLLPSVPTYPAMDLSRLSSPRVVGQVRFRARHRGRFDVSPDGQLVVLASTESLELFGPDGLRLALLHRRDLHGACCFVDDRRLVAARSDGSLAVFDVALLREAGERSDAAALAFGTHVTVASIPIGIIARSPDGARIAVACVKPWSKTQTADKLLRVLDGATLAEVRALRGMRRTTTCLAFSPDGRRLAAAGDKTVRVYDLGTGKVAHELGDDDDLGAAWRGDDELLTVGRTGGLRAWRLGDGTVRCARPYREPEMLPPCVTDDAVVVVTGGAYEPMTVRRLDPDTFEERVTQTISLLPFPFDAPKARPDGVVWVAEGLGVRCLRGSAMNLDPVGEGHTELTTTFALRADGRWGASADFAGHVVAWDLDAGRAVHAFEVETNLVAGRFTSRCRVLDLSLSDDAPCVLVATDRPSLRCWDLAADALRWRLDGAQLPPFHRAFLAPDAATVLLVGDGLTLLDGDGNTRWTAALDDMPFDARWRDDTVTLTSPAHQLTLRRRDGAVVSFRALPARPYEWRGNGFAVSPDGALVASGSQLGDLVVWRPETGEVVFEGRPRLHGIARLTGLAFTDDGALVVVDNDLVVTARDPETLAVRSATALPQPARWTVFVTRDGRRLVAPTHEGPWLVADVESAR